MSTKSEKITWKCYNVKHLILSYYVIISNNVVCFTVYKIPQINYGQLIILSIYVLSILGFVLLQRSIITYVSFLNFANLHLPVSLTCSFQWWCPCSVITFGGITKKKYYSSYYHLTPDRNGIIEHFLGLKQSQNGAQEAFAPVNLTCPF